MDKNKSQANEIIHIDIRMLIAIIVTFALLLGCLAAMFVGLALDAKSTPRGDGGGGGGGASLNVGLDNSGQDTGGVSSDGTLRLPSATASGSFLYSTDGMATIDNITSAAAVLIDITDGKTVAAKNADVKIYPASMTKVMTLLVSCERAKNPNALLTVTPEMVEKYNNTQNEGASIAFTWKEGNQVTVEQALNLIIYKSDTYACWLLAEHIAGSEEAFVALMNEKASSMGLTSTHFTNCTGLYNQDHYTTCREMAAIMAAVMNNSAASSVITKTEEYTLELYEGGQKTGESVSMWSGWYTGRLEKYRWGKAAAKYAGNGSDIAIIAGKTGYETVPTNCFVTAGEDSETGRKYVCVQVGRTTAEQTSVNTKTSTDDTRLIYQKYAKEPE